MDLSEVMLAEARHLATEHRVHNARFEQANAQTHPFPAGGSDVAISSLGLMFFAGPPAAFANIAAALRPGGRLALLCWQKPGRCEFFAVPLGAIAAQVTLPELRADGPGPFSLADSQRIRSLLAGAGFHRTDIDSVTEPMWAGTTVDDVICYYRGMPIAQTLLADAGEQATAAVTRALRERWPPTRTPAG